MNVRRSPSEIRLKSLLALLVIALLSVGAGACGSSGQSAGGAGTATPGSSSTVAANSTTTSSDTISTPPYTAVDRDKDNDIGAGYDDTHNSSAIDFGHAANASEKRMIEALVRRYYAAALASNGAKACAMLYSTYAEGIPEDYGQPPGPSYLRGVKTCSAAMTLVFKHFHAQLAVEVPKLAIRRVRVLERDALTVLGFGALPEREIGVVREGHTWRIDAMLDSELP